MSPQVTELLGQLTRIAPVVPIEIRTSVAQLISDPGTTTDALLIYGDYLTEAAREAGIDGQRRVARELLLVRDIAVGAVQASPVGASPRTLCPARRPASAIGAPARLPSSSAGSPTATAVDWPRS